MGSCGNSKLNVFVGSKILVQTNFCPTKSEVGDKSLLADDRPLDDDGKADQANEMEDTLVLQTAAVPGQSVR